MKDSIPYIFPLIMNILRYFLIAGLPFLIFYIFFPKAFSKNKIQARLAKKKDFVREVLYSMQTTLILVGVGLLFLKTPLQEYTQVYLNISEYPLWWIPVSTILALIIHDTYFYWMHRTVHHPALFKQVHLVHHKSVNPSPWASYSFHFLEGVLEAMVAPLVLLLIPMHPLALLLFTLIGFIVNVYGHLGYEIAPKWLRHSILFEVLNTSVHHNLHHAEFKGNYGLYFRIWDRVMGTEHPEYVKEYDKIQKRRFGNSTSGIVSVKGVFSLIFIFLIGFSGMALINRETSIKGKWQNEDTGAVIFIYEEGGYYFGELIATGNPKDDKKLRERNGLTILKDFKKESPIKYCCGTLFAPRKKKTIAAEIVLENPNTLRIDGQYGIYKGSQTLRRVD